MAAKTKFSFMPLFNKSSGRGEITARLKKTWKAIMRAVIHVVNYLHQHWRAVIVITGGVVILALVGRAVYLHWGLGWGWADWTGLGSYIDGGGKIQRGKTLWDWLELLIVPAVLALAALFFNRQERQSELKLAEERRKSDLEIAENRTQDEILHNYLDKMSELILEKQLMSIKRVRDEANSKVFIPESQWELDRLLNDDQRAVRDLAQVRTITVLRQLNRDRRNSVLQFLRDSKLADFILVKASLVGGDLRNVNLDHINLFRANLTKANLTRANLNGAILNDAFLNDANLSEANLSGATLEETFLNRADLSKANLKEAYLGKAYMNGANLSETYLIGANLNNATLNDANLTGAKVSNEQLSEAHWLINTTMPDGKKYDPEVHKLGEDQPSSQENQ